MTNSVIHHKRIYSIELLRVIFTLYIVSRHHLAASGLWESNCLWLGVEFFFVLSGFLLAKNFNENIGIINYLIDKYIRFLPLTIWGIVLCIATRSNIITHPLSVLSNLSLSILSNLFFLTETGIIVGGGAVNPPSWYLSVILYGGVLLLLCLKYCKESKLCIFLVVLLGLSMLRKYGYEPKNEGIVFAGISHRFIRGFSEISLGCIAFYALQSGFLSRLKANDIKILEIFSICLALIGPFFSIWQCTGFISLLVLNNALLLILLFSRGNSGGIRLLNYPLWEKLAKYTLSIYLTHYSITLLIYKIPLTSFMDKLIIFIIAMVISIIQGVGSHIIIEKNCLKLV